MKRVSRVLAACMLMGVVLLQAMPVQALPPIHIDPDSFTRSIDPTVLSAMAAAKKVDIPDDNLRDALCDLLGKEAGDPITRGDMAGDRLTGSVSLVDKGIRDLTGMEYAVNMQSLDLAGNPVAKVPEAMADLSNLAYLGLGECLLSAIPEHVWDLTQLKCLYLARNELEALPAGIGNMEELTTLVLDGNQLTGLADAIGSLTELKTLSLAGNDLTALPEAMKSCASLTELDLTGNRLAELPDWIGSLTHLRTLMADGNEIRSLPGSMAALSELTGLSLNFNRISEFPSLLMGLKSLNALYIAANDIKQLPPELPNWVIGELDLTWNDLDLNDPAIGAVLDGMGYKGVHIVSDPQKPVPTLTSDMDENDIVQLAWPLILDTYAGEHTYAIDGLRLQRKTGSGDYTTIAEMDSGATGYEDSDIEPGNTYTYKITARYKTVTDHFTYTTYRVAACDVAVAAVAEAPVSPLLTPQPTAAPAPAVVTPEAVAASGGGMNQSLLMGIGILLILLIGVLAALVVVLARRRPAPMGPIPSVTPGESPYNPTGLPDEGPPKN